MIIINYIYNNFKFSDIIVAIEPDDEDHLVWLLENDQYVEALTFSKDRKFKNHTYGSIGRDYIRYLIDGDELDIAAEKCKTFLYTNTDWEKEALAFSAKSSLKTLVPYLPVKEPQVILVLSETTSGKQTFKAKSIYLWRSFA